MRNLSKDSLETKETFLKLELVRAVHASRNIKHAGNFRKDYLLGAELQEHILRFSEIKYVWRYSGALCSSQPWLNRADVETKTNSRRFLQRQVYFVDDVALSRL